MSGETVAVSMSKIPIMFFRRRFLLLPACKNILRRPPFFPHFFSHEKKRSQRNVPRGKPFEFCLCKIRHTFSPLDSPFGLLKSLKISGKTDERTRGVKFLLKIPEETLLCAQRKVSLAPFFGHLSWVSKKGEKEF